MKKNLFKTTILGLICLGGVSILNATNYYSDPSGLGSMSNNGSFSSPWSKLSDIFAANKTFAPGDTIFLRNGIHGSVTVKGYNTDFVVIMPQEGHFPLISSLTVSAARYWKLYKLLIQSEGNTTSGKPTAYLVTFNSTAKDITLSNCTISSNLNTDDWTRDDWRRRAKNGIQTSAQLNSNYIIEDNLFKNVAFGIIISSSNCIVRRNTLQNFTLDASRIIASDVLFEGNKIYDLYKCYTVDENHDDLFQGFTQPNNKGIGQDTLKNVVLRGNIFINTTDTTRNFRGSAQGIGCFDGPFVNWTIENNIVICDQWNAIALYGGINCKIVNNTVMDPYPYTPIDPYKPGSTKVGPARIVLNQKSTSIPSVANIVRNNLVHDIVENNFNQNGYGLVTNNRTMGWDSDFKAFFVDVSDKSRPISFDLHLKAGSPAIDFGTTQDAPSVDFDGVTRPQGANVDAGAYEYIPAAGIFQHKIKNAQFEAYPNPFRDELNIQLKNTISTPVQIQIFSMSGQVFYDSNFNTFDRTIKISNGKNIPSGLYLLKVTDKNGLFSTIKLTKTNQ